LLFYIFRLLQVNPLELGFGVVGGQDGLGQYSDISTQAVLDLFKNVPANEEGFSSHVEISADEIENFCIPGGDVSDSNLNDHGGEIYVLDNKCFVCLVFFFVLEGF
jgi:hypothetical protein